MSTARILESMLRTSLLLLLIIAFKPVHAQADTLWVTYKAGMPLREGVYFDFKAFRLNTPSVPLARITDDQGLAVTDLRGVLSRLRYRTDSGRVEVLRMQRIWGFSQRGVVYVAAGNGFYRIGLVGSLAHMVYEESYRDWDPWLYGPGTVTRTVLLQQVIDMETGRALPFNAAGMDAALAHDRVLLDEFRALPKKKRNSQEALFRFLRLYNERHPLLFPE
ncbi:MAG TPA: hypothetical protein PKY96_09670 [Flavobacteriales bacterium]|nr:hypothetical protein [Flavobacteriales bacterium]